MFLNFIAADPCRSGIMWFRRTIISERKYADAISRIFYLQFMAITH